LNLLSLSYWASIVNVGNSDLVIFVVSLLKVADDVRAGFVYFGTCAEGHPPYLISARDSARRRPEPRHR
jgi:hypothetical protein